MFLKYKINSEIIEQNKKIKNLIEILNNFLKWKKFWYIILNSLSLVWKDTFSISYWLHAKDEKKDVSDFPWIDLKSPYWKDIYNFKEWYYYLQKLKNLNDKNIIFLNSILVDFINENYALNSKKMVRKWKVIYKTISWDDIINEMKKFLHLLNNWINWQFEASIIWYLSYLFFYIHPFHDWNWRTMRVLLEYLLTNRLWCKVPCVFFNFYLNYTKQEQYAILWELNTNEEWSLEKFIYSINAWIIKQIGISLEIFKDIDDYINQMVYFLKKQWFENIDLITNIYKNIYFENELPQTNKELEKLLAFLVKEKNFKFYMEKWKMYYYDPNFVNILKKRY